jgi:Ca2+-binding RTX toxin-like protein
VGNGIDIWVTDALRNNLVGLPLDLATLNIVRGRDAGMLSLNGVRAELFAATNGNTTLKPYTSWTEFRDNLVHQETLVNFVMAYSRDAVLNNFGTQNAAAWDADARKTGTGEEKAAYYAEYAAALRTAGEAAIADGAFMTFDQGFNSIDFWLGGLAEQAVPGGMLGSTFDFIFAMQMVKLQNADRFYYLNRLGGTNMLAEIEAQLFSDIVMRNTGAQNLYTDIFSVADSTVYLENPTSRVFNTAFELSTVANQVDATDINGNTVKVSTAGWALNADQVTYTFYGNPGDYLDSRGVLNANGFGNASEVIVGYDDANLGDRINANGGNDTVWGKKGNDTIEGGKGNDFLHGGDGDDVVTDSQGDDLLWGDAGNDSMNGGSGLDQLFGGDGQDTIYGGTEADVIEGGRGDDLIFGDNGSAPSVVGDLSGADIIAGGEGNDTMYGGGGADALDGGEGDDVFYGGADADAMTGGLGFGNDLFIMDAVDAVGNAIDGGLGYDTVDYTASNGQVLTINGPVVGLHLNLSVPNVLADSFLHIENLIGTRFNDTLVGGAAIINVYLTDVDGQPILDQNNLRILDQLASTAASVGFAVANDLGDPVIGIDPVTGDPVLVAEDVLIQGGAGDDIVTGGQGNDTLDGGAVTGRTGPGYVPLANDPNSADTLSGGLGNDVYVVDSNNDVIIEGVVTDVFGLALIDPATGNPTPELVQGIDRVDTTLATYSIRNIANIENLSYIGLTTFNGTGNALNNVITGGAGNDTLNGREGIDTLVGGLGDDIYTVDSTTDVITEAAAGGTDRVNATLAAGLTYTLNAEVENLTLLGNAASNGTGNTVANLITGNTGANVLTSVANTLSGTFDTLVGGTGNDTYVVDHAGVVITEATGAGTDTVSTSVLSAFTLSAANVENLIYTGVGNFAGTGSSTANIITGGTGNDSLDGAAGNDTLIGGAGNDTLIGGTGVDSMTGGLGNDTFVFALGSSGTTNNRDRIADFLVGTDKIDLSSFGALQFIGSGNFTTAGQVRVTTAGNVTTVEVNTAGANGSELSVDLTGALALTAADFSSNVTVAPPTPPVTPSGPPVVPNGPAAALNQTGTNAANTMTGDTGNDTLSGGRGNDTIDGGAGNDVLNGGRDTDVITGGLGNDVLTGGTGADAFIFNSVLNGTTNVDNITDFTAVDDTIRLENAIFTALTATGVLNTNFLRLGTAAVDNNDFIIYDANSGNLWYDADANGVGAQILFATLANQETLTRNDFVVI